MCLLCLFPATVLFAVIGTYSSELISDDSIVLAGHSRRVYHGSVSKWMEGDKSTFSLQALEDPDGFTNASGVAFHKKRNFVIVSDAGYGTILAIQVNTSFAFYIHIGTSSGVGHAVVDWINGNIYWLDRVYGWIALQSVPMSTTFQSLNPNFKIIVDKYLDNPSGLAVDPFKGYLFWTDKGIQPKIERSGLRGSSRQIIVWEGLLKPTALCVDVHTERIYWTDSQRGTVEYSDLNGDNRHIIVSQTGSEFYWIDIYRGRLIVNDIMHSTTHQFSTSGVEQSGTEIRTTLPLYEFVIFSQEKQQNGQEVTAERCDKSGCSQMCFQLSDNVIECDCEDGHTLEQDGKTCTVDTRVLQRHILFTNATSICAITINIINSIEHLKEDQVNVDCTVVQHNKTIRHFAFDAHNRKIFFTDGQAIYEQDAFETNKKILYQSAYEITDIDYNWKTHSVFWTETAAGTIFKLDSMTRDSGAVIVVTGQHRPTSIAVDPYYSLLFWFATDNVTSAIRLNKMDSQGTISTISTIHQLSTPTDLEYDRNKNRLVWCDGSSLGSIHADGTDETDLPLKPNKQYRSVTVFKEYTILTFDDTFHALLHDVTNEKVFNLHSIADVNDIHVFADSLQPMDLEPCEKDNGGCDQICLPNGELACACKVGHRLMADGKTCTSGIVTSDFFLVTDSLNGEIYQIDRESLQINVLNLGRSKPVFATSDGAGNIYWVDNLEKKAKRMSLEEQSIYVLPVNDIIETSTVAIDATSGQAYITLKHTVLVVKETEVRVLIQNPQGTPRNLKLHPTIGLMFWIETGEITRIAQADMDGSTIVDIIRSDISSPEDIAIDYQDDVRFSCSNHGLYQISSSQSMHRDCRAWHEIYWSDSALSKIEAVDIYSHSRRVVTSMTSLKPVALDVHEDYIYMISQHTFNRAISRMRKDGTGFEIVFQSALVGRFTSLWVYKDMSNTVNAACAMLNGGCSTLCLPRPSGRSCQCSDGDQLFEDKTTCTTAPKCTEKVTHVNLDGSCLPYLNQICTFTCEDGYKNTASYATALCLATGKWNITSNVCEVIKAEQEPLPVAVIGGVGGGGILVAAVAVVILVCLCKRKKRLTQRKFSQDVSFSRPRYDEFPVINSTSPKKNPYNYPEMEIPDEKYDEIGEANPYVDLNDIPDKSEPYEPPPDYVPPRSLTKGFNSPPPPYKSCIQQNGNPDHQDDQLSGVYSGGYLTASLKGPYLTPSQTGAMARSSRDDAHADSGYLNMPRDEENADSGYLSMSRVQ